MTEPEALGPDRLKHLEFIQAVITRCATTSFVIKGWTLSIVAAVLALVAKQIDPWIAGAILVPILAFWGLDAFFLRQERMYRSLYEDARRPDGGVDLLDMSTASYHDGITWFVAARSFSLVAFYGALAVVGLGFLIISLGSR